MAASESTTTRRTRPGRGTARAASARAVPAPDGSRSRRLARRLPFPGGARRSDEAARGCFRGARWRARAAAPRGAGRRPRRPAPGPPPATGSSTRSTTSSSPTTPSGPPSCGAGTRAWASRSQDAGGARGRKGYAVDRRDRLGVPRLRRAADARCVTSTLPRCSSATAGRSRPTSAASACTSGRWCTGSPRTPPGTPTGRCGSGPAGTDAVVESHRIACSHFDAFRFFTPRPGRSTCSRPVRDDRAAYEQPALPARHHGPLQARLPADPAGARPSWWPTASSWPATSGSSTCGPRRTTSPTSAFEPIRIETVEGKQEYAAAQRAFAERAAPLRERLRQWSQRVAAATSSGVAPSKSAISDSRTAT